LEENAESPERLVLWSAPDEEIDNLHSEQIELLEEIILEGDKRKEDKVFHDALEYVWEHKKTENAECWPPKQGNKTMSVDVVKGAGVWLAKWCGVTYSYGEKLYYLLTQLGYEVILESDAFFDGCRDKEDIDILSSSTAKKSSDSDAELQPLAK
jgi:hypothetical protein